MSLRIPLPTLNSTGGVYCTHYGVIFFFKQHCLISKHLLQDSYAKRCRAYALNTLLPLENGHASQEGASACGGGAHWFSEAVTLTGQTLGLDREFVFNLFSLSEFASRLEITFPIR